MRWRRGETVTWISRAVTSLDTDGNDVFTETPHSIDNAAIYPPAGAGTAESVQGRDQVTIRLTVLVAADNAVAAVDRMTVRGDVYEVEGKPELFRSPITGRDVLAVPLIRVEG